MRKSLSARRLSIRISPALERAIQEQAHATGRSASEVVREVLEQHFISQSPPSCYEIAHKARAIGCVEDAPPDLSTNPMHFEGFGN